MTANGDLRELPTTPIGTQGKLELGLAGGGAFRWAVADITSIVAEARERFDLWPVPTAALGRCLAGAALLQRLATKSPSRLMLEVRGDGPILRVLAEADEEGNLRGMVGDPWVEVPNWPNNKLGVGRAVGKGYLRVIRAFDDGRPPYQSQVELISGEIGIDVAHYLEQSEQTHSAVLLGVLNRPDGLVASAGGMVVEALPGAPEEDVERLEANLASFPGISEVLEVEGIEGVVVRVLKDLDTEVVEARPLRYRCRCSRERFLRRLTLLSAEDRAYVREEPVIKVDCHFCGAHYEYSPDELMPQG
jgi:molecular chaperone Hsp33